MMERKGRGPMQRIRLVCLLGVQILCSTLVLYILFFIRPLLPLATSVPSGKKGDAAKRGECIGKPPIIFVHPAVHNGACWFFYERLLRKSGYAHRYFFEYSCRETSLDAVGLRLARFVEAVALEHPGQKPVLIGASLGGLVSRSALTHAACAEHVGGVVTVVSPHQGSRLAVLVPFCWLPLLASIRFRSPTIRALERFERLFPAPPLPRTAFFSRFDELVIPAAAPLPIPEQAALWRVVQTPPCSHLASLLHPAVLRAAVEAVDDMAAQNV